MTSVTAYMLCKVLQEAGTLIIIHSYNQVLFVLNIFWCTSKQRSFAFIGITPSIIHLKLLFSTYTCVRQMAKDSILFGQIFDDGQCGQGFDFDYC